LHVIKDMDGTHTRTLERALKVLQTKERLAIALEIPVTELNAYMAGERPDIVANGHSESR